ncbi:MAG: exopolysaccharide transport family protein [Xanthobacteraceae bacterium]|nr:exopolysaccharide transport family protein [Xanthobacteraceae bacterium]
MRTVHGRRQTDTGDEISLGTVARAVWRNKRSIIGPTLLIAAAAFVAVNLISPRYKSEARVLVEGRENIFLRPEAEKQMMERGSVDPEAVTSQVQIILSRDLAREVIKELNLAELPEFNAALKEFSPLQALRTIGIFRDPMSMTIEERVLAAYYERLTAFAVDKSRVISIEFQSAGPELAPKVANLVAEKYLTLQQVAKQDQARAASKWLSGELEKLRDKVSEAEGKVEEFRARSNLFFGSGSVTLSNQQLTDLNTQVSAARAQKADAEARGRLIREAIASGQPIESSDIVNSELIRRLSEQRVTLRAQLAEQSSTLLPQHPRIREMRAQINDLDQQIRSEGERLARSLENEARVAGARLETLNATLDQAKRQSASTSEQDVQLRALEREAKAQKDLFESYLAKYREATARDSIAAAPADARIISRAVVSNIPFYPKKMPIVLIATLGTFSLAMAFVVTGALLSGESQRPAPLQIDTEPVQGQAAAAAEPVAARPAKAKSAKVKPERSRLPAAANVPPPKHAPAPGTSIDAIAASLQQAGEAGRCVAVIGAARDVGTTLSAIALSRQLAQTSRVILVDLAFAGPNIEVISSDPSAPGIAELVRGEASFGDIITRDRATRLHLVAAGQLGNDAEGIFVSEMLWAALGALAQSYDHLVVDAGAQSVTSLRPVAQAAPWAVLVGGVATAAPALAALSEELAAAGFAEVSMLTGPPPALEPASVQSAA